MKLFDLHCDSLYEGYKTGESVIDGDLAVTVKKAEAFERWGQVFAIWTPDGADNAKSRVFDILAHFRAVKSGFSGSLPLDSTRDFILSLEGGGFISSCDEINELYNSGFRIITLTWNGRNALAGGCAEPSGVTALGRRVIERMNALSMPLDLSHLCDQSFFEALDIARYPIATHVCCRSVQHHRRNLTDEQLRLIISRGGIIGLCLYPVFLGGDDVFERFYLHYRHLCELGGEQNAAIGSDFDGAKQSDALSSTDKLSALYDYLIKKGVSASAADALFYNNARKYFEKIALI